MDSYKDEIIQKIERIKKYYDLKKNIFEEIINQYSKNLFNYQIIKNFDLNDNLFDIKDSFSQKTRKILNIFNNMDNQSIENKSINLIKNIELKETVYSLCFLKKHNLIVIGLEKKLNLWILNLI